MHTTVLRKVGGSVMLAVPPALLELLELSAGSSVALSLQDGRLVIAPKPKPRYSLDQLLARCSPDAPPPPENSEWLSSPPVGEELL